MAQPYNITQFNAPGVIDAYQNAQMNRVRLMMAEKQAQLFGLQMGARQAIAAYANGGDSPASGPAGGASAAPASAPAGGASVTPASATTGAQAAAPAAPQDDMARRRELLKRVMVLDPEMASNLATTFSTMDKDEVDARIARSTRLAQLAAGIMQLSNPEARKTALQQAIPELQSLGLSAQQIQNFNPTDENLRQIVAQGQDVANIAKFVLPDVQNVRQGGAVVRVDPRTGQATTVYESPTMVGPNGEVFARPPQLSSMPQPMTATNPKTGEKLQSLDGGKTWQPMGGQSGASSTGGFQ